MQSPLQFADNLVLPQVATNRAVLQFSDDMIAMGEGNH